MGTNQLRNIDERNMWELMIKVNGKVNNEGMVSSSSVRNHPSAGICEALTRWPNGIALFPIYKSLMPTVLSNHSSKFI